MITTGHLESGAVAVVARGTGESLGFAYTVSSQGGQQQRWLLYRDPQNAFDIKPPPASMVSWSLADWKAKVPALWRPGSLYVWAQADVVRHGEVRGGVEWTKIPPESMLPKPRFFGGMDDDFQLDPGGGKAIDVLQGAARGLAYSHRGVLDQSSVEYWVLPADFSPAGRNALLGIAPGSEKAASLPQFIEVANRAWGPGSALVITGCTNYRGDRAPAAP
ncbi:hypothetical protein WMF20_42000 [Sorangium sp. So ce834]|uniref:hypothetical protein n=1 Tax=Sorangium sp. So ce834 TaxID=3133321 RepID=UPI003F6334DD